MHILKRHLFSGLMRLVAVAALLMLVLVWLMQSLRFLDLVINKGLGLGTFLTLTGYLMPMLLTFVLPLAVFAGACVLFKRLNDDNELSSLFSAGLSPLQIIRPTLFAGIVLMILTYANGLYLMPKAQTAFKDLQFELRQTQSQLFLEENRFNQIDDNLMVYIDKRTSQTSMRGLLVHDTRDPQAPVTWLAQSGEIVLTDERQPELKLMNGVRQDARADRQSMVSFTEQTLTLLHTVPNLGERSYALEEFNLSTLADKARNAPTPKARQEAAAEWYKRLLWPLSTLVMILIAAVFLIIPKARRYGVSRPLFFAITVGIGYQLILFWLDSLATEGYRIGIHGMWLLPLMTASLCLIQLNRRPG